MKIIRIFSDKNGESHFEDINIPLRKSGHTGKLSNPIGVKNIIFRETEEDYNYDWHNPSRRQYMITLGPVEIEASDGEKRILDTGNILLAEDVTGKGHRSRAVNGQKRKSVFVTLE